MAYIIKSKHNHTKVDKSFLETRKNIGDSIGKNRILTLINEEIDENLKSSSKLLFILSSYFLRSWNYVHNPAIANGKKLGEKIYDWFSWFSILMFVILIFTGLAKPFVEAAKLAANADLSFGNKLADAFAQPDNIVLLSFSAFFLVISAIYLYLILKIKKENNKLSLDGYVTKKISFCLKFQFLIKFEKQHLNKHKEADIIVIDNFETNGDNDKWIYLQMYNLLSSIFLNFSLCFAFTEYDETKLKHLYEVIQWDFKHIEVTEISIDPQEAFIQRNKEDIPVKSKSIKIAH